MSNHNFIGLDLAGANLTRYKSSRANLTNARMCFLPFLPNLDGANVTGAIVTEEEKRSTAVQKRLLKNKGAIVGGASEDCYKRTEKI